MLLAREGVRGAVRIALHRAAAGDERAAVTDGWVDPEPGRRTRVAVKVSPLAADDEPGERDGLSDYFVVSFEDRGAFAPPPAGGPTRPPAEESFDDLRRLRADLQSTIEELQTTNEELKASHEEAMSMNEELQSANEELETSKEEMQSLNEELTTVNAQLRVKMEEHQASSSDLASLLASTDIAVLFLDPGLRIRRYTPAIRDLVDLIAGDVGRPLSALARRFDDPHLDDDALAVLERLVPVEREVAGAGGRHFLRRVLPYRTTDNRIDGVVITFVDISARKRAEEGLRASEEQFRRAIEDAPIPVLMQAEDGRVLHVSRTWTELTGYSLADVPTAEAWLTRAYGPGAEAVRAYMHELFRGERKTLGVEFAIRTRNGAERQWSFSASAPGTLRDGQRCLVGMALDVTDRRRAEEALRASEDRLRRMLNTDVVGVLVFDESGALVEANDAFLRLTGYSRQEVEARALNWRTMTPPEHIPESEREKVRLAETGRIGPYEKEFFRKDRSRIWMQFAGASLGDGTLVEYCTDISDRKRAEAVLRESEERLRLALSAARMGIWTWDVGGDSQTRDANLNRLLGLEPVESRQPLGEFLRDHVHPDDLEAVAASFDATARRGQPLHLEFRVIRPDGAVRWLRDQGDVSRASGAEAPVLAGACVDVTDLKEAEAAVRASEERLRLIVASASDYAIFTLDAGRQVTSWSPGAEAVFGYAEAEIVGRPGDLLFTPEDRTAGAPEREARSALRDGRAADERWHLRKDGTRFYASGVLTPMGDGGSRGFVKVCTDLTERKRMEDALRQARDELERRVDERTSELARANAALTELLRRVVTAQEDERRRISRELHDGLGQELTALILGLKALEQAIPEDASGRERLVEVEQIVNRIGREAHELAVDLRPTALDDLGLGPALSTYVARWSERTGVDADFEALGLDGERLPPEVETTVYRVVQEALNNVAKHAEARHASVIAERRGGELTALVEDDGRGFDPGRSVGASGRRSLGLLGMRERVGLVGGTLLVDSAEGEGTTVRVRVPLDHPAEEAGHDA